MDAINNNGDKAILYDLEVYENTHVFSDSIQSEMEKALLERETLKSKLNDSLDQLRLLTPKCDKLDYALAASSGALCGILDIFFLAEPGKSPFSNITDKWFEERTKDFAKLNGWNGEGGLASAIRKLESKFKVPYDQTGMMDAALEVYKISAKNHHFKSLAHNPSLFGLFFSVLDQFGDQDWKHQPFVYDEKKKKTAHFVFDDQIALHVVQENKFELYGKTVPAKLFSAVVNWFGHLISDMSGSSGSKGRGMGIPSPLWTWANDIIAIKESLNIKPPVFDKNYNQMALELYEKGYDVRFQTAQAIPVLINEMTVRLLYSVRRMIRYYSMTPVPKRSFKACWETCEPFSNATVKRMLTVAHGTFCLIDTSDALIKGSTTGAGSFGTIEFFMRLNITGIGRFTISLYGEAERGISSNSIKNEVTFLNREKTIIDDYICGLEKLAELYDDQDLVSFVDDFKSCDCYKDGLIKSSKLATKRGVPESKNLKTKADIDAVFTRRG